MTEQYVVTGGSGFIGTNLVEQLRAQGKAVINLDPAAPRNPAHRSLWRRCDLADRAGLEEAFRDLAPIVVFNLGAETRLNGKQRDDYRANDTGVQNLLNVLERNPQCRLIHASSMLVCTLGYVPTHDTDYQPDTLYGQSKVEGERLVRASAVECWSIVRPTSCWGPWFGIPYRAFFEAVRRGVFMKPMSTCTRRSLSYVGNAIHQLDAIARATSSVVHGKTYYIADYEPVVLEDWADLIADAFGVRRPLRMPLAVLSAAGLAGDFLQHIGMKDPPLTTRRVRNMTRSAVFDMSTLEQLVGRLPFTLEEGVRQTVAWLSAPDSQR